MIGKYKKSIIIFLVIYISIMVIICLKIIVNKNFIKDYPYKEQSIRLLFLSTLNFYEPYIAPYNYGNYYYKHGRYEDAYKKYKEALKYKIPKTKQCAVDINISLTIINLAEKKSNDEALELYEEAKGYLNGCSSIVFSEEEKSDNEYLKSKAEEINMDIREIQTRHRDDNVSNDNISNDNIKIYGNVGNIFGLEVTNDTYDPSGVIHSGGGTGFGSESCNKCW